MEGYSRINYSGVVFSYAEQEGVSRTLHVKEHTLVYILSGAAEVHFGDSLTRVCAGECVFLRKDHRVAFTTCPPADGVPFRSVALFFCRKFLMSYYRQMAKDVLPLDARRSRTAVLKIPAGPELESLFVSLTPYLDTADTLPEEVAWMKRQEGLRCVLAADRNVYASLFDFTQLWKIDLLTFLEENYQYDLSVPELARYTGRSLSSFKRDFKRISELTPEKWILRRRLQEAHRLLSRGSGRVGDAMAAAGFKDPAFFSRAYKREFGYSPRETPGIKPG